jgi:indolepyruvate ferredoxin oxidoreductase
MGDSIATNLFMLGYAFQKGLVPLTEASIMRAIELNGVSVESNKLSFQWGRRAAVDLQQVEGVALPGKPVVVHMPQTLDALVARRVAFLTVYQNAAYAKRYEALVDKVRRAEANVTAGDALTRAVAKYFFKLMAYKDEYEVARLYTDGTFQKTIENAFEGDFTLKYNLAPPLFAKRDAQGRLIKAEYRAWMGVAFKVLARLRFLRGTALDVFGKTEERRMERKLIDDYERSLTALSSTLTAGNLPAAIELANLPEHIRGFGHVKLANVEQAWRRWQAIERELSGAAATSNKKAA